LKKVSVIAGVLALAVSLSIAAIASAQEPSPTPAATGTSTAKLCPTGGTRGGEELQAVNGASVTPPGGGTFVVIPATPGVSSPQFTVCYVEGNASVTISAQTCDEISRQNPDDSDTADFVLDVIVDSCQMGATTPTATATTPAAGNGTVTPTATAATGPISPPNTGDGGLK
jgi:hypothetical protein